MQNIIGRTLNTIGSSKNSKLFKIYKKKNQIDLMKQNYFLNILIIFQQI